MDVHLTSREGIFPGCPPTTYGLDADIGVLYADDNERRERTYAADPDLLQQTLGTDWRTRIQTRVSGGVPS